ncbi:hypothetical protein UFOVP652_36 [uncultured Caudovirales phage]|uniref:Uncharacterized protein n=1 Tax=uncultured Caudovirales phage TaxID=2100421 RepID=A0A6J5NHG0_9CAUD|nr:hypothetical protein UFOVP652_36 [uncultured Caudovirales phage]CAB5223768.1 hypothetical protein UFOVP734_3 [uncultured Caudovirales phage]
MSFQEWWDGLTESEKKVLGEGRARYAWEECQKYDARSYKLQVSGWTLSEGTSPDKVWISEAGGEGGSFKACELAQAIGAFYKEKF